ncbi:hypothetical protein F5Y13DRAFT_91121 [Hypoxylon sp. FL1857]|nr:hypothetical protein F5Y13DRAFT_91121 [Hypoxylon sp. FL1857]
MAVQLPSTGKMAKLRVPSSSSGKLPFSKHPLERTRLRFLACYLLLATCYYASTCYGSWLRSCLTRGGQGQTSSSLVPVPKPFYPKSTQPLTVPNTVQSSIHKPQPAIRNPQSACSPQYTVHSIQSTSPLIHLQQYIRTHPRLFSFSHTLPHYHLISLGP